MKYYKRCRLCLNLFNNSRKNASGSSKTIGSIQFAKIECCGQKCKTILRYKNNTFRCDKGICYFYPANSKKGYYFEEKYLEEVSKNYWYLDSQDYATCRPRGTQGKMCRLHTIVCPPDGKLVADHIDSNKCNNLSSNLESRTNREFQKILEFHGNCI